MMDRSIVVATKVVILFAGEPYSPDVLFLYEFLSVQTNGPLLPDLHADFFRTRCISARRSVYAGVHKHIGEIYGTL